MNATQVGQKLGMSAVKLNKILLELDVYSKLVKRGKVFKQWFIDSGYGEMKQTEDGYTQALFTTKGEQWVFEKLKLESII
jgi:phage antirepressor YoqD-like protein